LRIAPQAIAKANASRRSCSALGEESRRSLHLREPSPPRATGDVATQEKPRDESSERIERRHKFCVA
jgi:hypothetical protein